MKGFGNRWLPGHLAVAAVLVSGAACVGASGPPAQEAGKSEVVAQIGERKITLDELDAKTRSTNAQVFQQLYEARRAALDQMIEEQLLAEAAKARGVSTEELLRAEVEQKVAPVSDADVEAFYNQNQNRMGGQPLDAMKPRISQHLGNQRAAEARTRFFDQLKANAKMTIDLEPPRVEVEVAQNDPAMGPKGAKVTIVEFSDFQ